MAQYVGLALIVGSILAVIGLYTVTVDGVKTRIELFILILNVLIIVNSVGLFVYIYARWKSAIRALLVAIILPAFVCGYPALTERIDTYRAEHTPGNFYYKGD